VIGWDERDGQLGIVYRCRRSSYRGASAAAWCKATKRLLSSAFPVIDAIAKIEPGLVERTIARAQGNIDPVRN
jgi:hypothetical protein